MVSSRIRFLKMNNDNVGRFFIPDNRINLPDELDYTLADLYIRSAEAFSRSTYQSVYIIDYFRQNFLYVSPNPMFLCGLTPGQMMQMGYQFYFDFVPPGEHSLLVDINSEGFAFYNTIPPRQRKDWYIQYDFHIINDGHLILVNHKLTPLALTSDGRIWLALCVVSASSHSEPGHIELHRAGSPGFLEFNRVTRRWDRRSMPSLTDGEKSVITLSIQGLTMSGIAERMCLSLDTIKKYRTRIFEKMGVRNISEAIMAAANNKML